MKEQQFYIETLHQDMEQIEKQRARKYKQEELERVKLMEDIIKLYEKIKAFDGSREDIERRMSAINDKVSQINKSTVNTERKTLSPREQEGYREHVTGSPSFLERQANEAGPRTLTANQLHLKRRKAYTTARPSISQ